MDHNKSIFASQDNEDLKLEAKRFYDYQKAFIKKHNLKSNSKFYIDKTFLQKIVTVYQKMLKNNKKNKTVEFLFGKAMDIMIRENITDRKFIRYNDETKGDFYSYALFRCFEYAIGTFDPSYSAFNYFTTTIRNSFLKEINDINAQKNIATQLHTQNGIESVVYNIDANSINDLEQDYNIQYNLSLLKETPMFIEDVIRKFGILQQLEISLNPNEPKFKRKKIKFDYFLPIGESGIIFKYIDIFECNENNGQSKFNLQNEILKAREFGYQTFYLFSDIWLDENLDENIIWFKIENMINNIKINNQIEDGINLMISYIPKEKLSSVSEPNWWYVCPKRNSRGLPTSQTTEHYMKLKEIEPACTRVWDAGNISF